MPRFTIKTSRTVDAPSDVVWVVVGDPGRYHEVVDTLVATDITTGAGEGMTRHCVDTRGREWDETCTLWDEGHSYRMTVDISSYPASFRALLKRMEGTWTVTPEGERTRIDMQFDGDVRFGPAGRAAVAAMGKPSILDAIMDGYEAQISRLT